MDGKCMTPEQAIHALPALAGAEVERRLSAGPVSSAWLLRLGEGRAVLTIDTPLARALGLDRAREYHLLEQLVPYGLGPAPVAVDAIHGLLAVKALDGRCLEPDEFRQTETLIALGQLLARLHALDLPAPDLDLPAAMNRYADLAGGPETLAIARDATAQSASLPRSGKRCLCHNDIHPANLFWQPNGALSLVDWEYAGRTDPLYEFAVLAEHNGLSRPELSCLLKAYRAADGLMLSRRDIAAWCSYYRAIQQLWQMAVEPGDTHADDC